jgi:hypothetical protein
MMTFSWDFLSAIDINPLSTAQTLTYQEANSSTQRNFEDRLIQRIEKMNEYQWTRSEKLDASIQHLQTGIHDIASRLLDLAVGMQRLEVKLDRVEESESSNMHQHGAQKYGTAITTNSQYSMSSRLSETSGAGWDPKIKRTQDSLPVDTQQDAAIRKESFRDAVKMSIENFENEGSESELVYHNNRKLHRQDSDCTLPSGQLEPGPSAADMLPELDTKLRIIDKKLGQISASLGIKSGANEGDDEEDRRRLKEKLKAAIEVDRRSRVLTIVSRSEVWLEYIFGICSPDQRLGKRGSR